MMYTLHRRTETGSVLVGAYGSATETLGALHEDGFEHWPAEGPIQDFLDETYFIRYLKPEPVATIDLITMT